MANAEKASHHQERTLPEKFFGMRNKTKKAISVRQIRQAQILVIWASKGRVPFEADEVWDILVTHKNPTHKSHEL